MLKDEIFDKFEFDSHMITFDGGHTLPENVIGDFVKLIANLLDRSK